MSNTEQHSLRVTGEGDASLQASKRAARPDRPAQQNFFSGRAGPVWCFIVYFTFL